MYHISFFILAALSYAESSSKKPNILFILSDDQGFGDVSFTADSSVQPGAGGARWVPNPPRTPNLDALAGASGSIRFDRMYSGSPVCSPTRASLLSGRTPDRECVFNAEGCGQEPAWSCVNPEPFPGGWSSGASKIFTSADAATAAGYATLHAGKFHLGNFFPKTASDPSYAYKKWPVMHPGMLGFSEWFSTEASASSTMCNCGCEPAWPTEAPGCVIGGGVYVMNQSYDCTNYWGYAGTSPTPPHECLVPTESTLACVTNSTTKIPGDDSLFLLERFSSFLNSSLSANRPFFATLQLHTNHQPHPALPEWYFAYNDTTGKPAGDYLGTLSQMDFAIGQLVSMLRGAGVFDDTLIWYAADNGPHPGDPGGIPVKNTATNGLRQCKASVFEGGIHVPGFVSWPDKIKSHVRSSVPVYVPDFLPTVLDVLGVTHPHPEFAADGTSILPLINGQPLNRSLGFLAWRLGKQVALLDAAGRYKYVRNPDPGQCDKDASSYPYSAGPFVFDLEADPTESAPLNDTARVKAMDALALAWEASIAVSQVNESMCLPPVATPARFKRAGACLMASGLTKHASLTLDAKACTGNDKTALWLAAPTTGDITAASDPTWCFHQDASECAAGTQLWMGQECADGTTWDAVSGTISVKSCPGMCAGLDAASGAIQVMACDSTQATGWSLVGDAARGRYVQPFD